MKNLAVGWCSVTALGKFDHKRGGHLVLWEPGLVIEFPPGSTILIPSAAIHHSNIPIGAKELRQSITQFSARAIFSYIDNGYKTNHMVELHGEKKQVLVSQKLSKQLADGLALYSSLPELNILKKPNA